MQLKDVSSEEFRMLEFMFNNASVKNIVVMSQQAIADCMKHSKVKTNKLINKNLVSPYTKKGKYEITELGKNVIIEMNKYVEYSVSYESKHENNYIFDIQNRRYVGSKYKITKTIKELIEKHCVGNTFFDVFAGTGIVTDVLNEKFSNFIINDFLFSNEIIYKAFFLQNEFDSEKLFKIKDMYNSESFFNGGENYFSKNFGDKFFLKEDALKIGEIREDIQFKYKNSEINEKEFCVLLASLIYSVDKIANTVGHYDAYFKKESMLKEKNKLVFSLIKPRIFKDDQKINIFRKDANDLVKSVKTDIAFIDPPYNSRQHSRFYHVLENLTKWEKPELFGVAMKPELENMSNYCKVSATDTFEDLIKKINAKYIVVTYNNNDNPKSKSSKNKISFENLKFILEKKGGTQVFERPHSYFNTGKSEFSKHLEYVFITEVKN